jgi:hypothetical protein
VVGITAAGLPVLAENFAEKGFTTEAQRNSKVGMDLGLGAMVMVSVVLSQRLNPATCRGTNLFLWPLPGVSKRFRQSDGRGRPSHIVARASPPAYAEGQFVPLEVQTRLA